MRGRISGTRRSFMQHHLAVLACVCLAVPAFAQDESHDEQFELVDPYTHGEKKLLEKAGYVSFGPFQWCDNVRTEDIAKALGPTPVLWVETAHFRLASTLKTYKVAGDAIERKELEGEIARMKPRFEKLAPLGPKLDPWLRLHLYAQRLEEAYADFEKSFGLKEADFGAGADAVAEGPYLGMPMKFTVFLAEKQSTLGRYEKFVMNGERSTSLRERLPGDSLFVGTSAEELRGYGFDLDAAMHAQVVSDIVLNFIDGFRNSQSEAPIWFKFGLAYVHSRRADERFTVYAGRARRTDDDSAHWEPRVNALAVGNYAPTFKEMSTWTGYENMDDRGQMSAWSHVLWMLAFEPPRLRKFLFAVTDPLGSLSPPDQVRRAHERQLPALEEALGRKTEALEDAWRAYVLKNYPKK